MRRTRAPIPTWGRKKTRPYACHHHGKSGAKLARKFADAYPDGSYGGGLRKMFAQKNRGRLANRKPRAAA